MIKKAVKCAGMSGYPVYGGREAAGGWPPLRAGGPPCPGEAQ